MSWLNQVFGTEKVIIGLLHLKALPGDPFYEGSMEEVIRRAKEDLEALQDVYKRQVLGRPVGRYFGIGKQVRCRCL